MKDGENKNEPGQARQGTAEQFAKQFTTPVTRGQLTLEEQQQVIDLYACLLYTSPSPRDS